MAGADARDGTVTSPQGLFITAREAARLSHQVWMPKAAKEGRHRSQRKKQDQNRGDWGGEPMSNFPDPSTALNPSLSLHL